MKAIVEFAVVGDTKTDLSDQAKARYNQLMGTDGKELPHTTVITITPCVINLSGEVESWEGEVHISENLLQ